MSKKDKDKDKEVEKGPFKRDSNNQYGELNQDDQEQDRSPSCNNDAVIDQAHKVSEEKSKGHKDDKSK